MTFARHSALRPRCVLVACFATQVFHVACVRDGGEGDTKRKLANTTANANNEESRKAPAPGREKDGRAGPSDEYGKGEPSPVVATGPCAKVEAQLESVLDGYGDDLFTPLSKFEPHRVATVETEPLHVGGVVIGIPKGEYRLRSAKPERNLYYMASDTLGFSIGVLPSLGAAEDDALWGPDDSNASVIRRSFELKRGDIVCTEATLQRAMQQVGALELKTVVLPYPDTEDDSYAAFADIVMPGSLQVLARTSTKATQTLLLPATAHGEWMMTAYSGPPKTIAILQRPIELYSGKAARSDTVPQLVVELLEGDACAARKLLRKPLERLPDADREALRQAASNCSDR